MACQSQRPAAQRTRASPVPPHGTQAAEPAVHSPSPSPSPPFPGESPSHSEGERLRSLRTGTPEERSASNLHSWEGQGRLLLLLESQPLPAPKLVSFSARGWELRGQQARKAISALSPHIPLPRVGARAGNPGVPGTWPPWARSALWWP